MVGSCSPDEPGISIFCHEFPALWEEEARESNAKPHFNRVLVHCSRIPYRSFGRSRVLHSDWTKTGGGPGQSPSKSFFPLGTDSAQYQKLTFWIEKGGVLQVQSTPD